MVTTQKEITITNIVWEDHHDEYLRESAYGDLEIVKAQVQNGYAQLWECTSPRNAGYVVTRIDPGPELCLVLGEGRGLAEFAPPFIAFAKKQGITVRVHVRRKGLIKMFSRIGLRLDEYVLRGYP